MLLDSFNRPITYLRLAVTDRCDFRCIYCMNRHVTFLPRDQLLSLEELAAVGKAFVELGVTKIRITGGEPLIRRNILELLQQLSRLAGLKELVMTTNGVQLAKMASALRAAGVQRINISLDTLKPERFQYLTRIGKLSTVLRGIDAALAVGFDRLKLNSVILKDYNHDESVDLVHFAIQHGIDITFIEEMSVGLLVDRDQTFYPAETLFRDLAQTFTLIPTPETTEGPARYYRIPHSNTRVGFIAPHRSDFCETCNRVRVMPEGRLLLCLGQECSVDLRSILRAHPGQSLPLHQAIIEAIALKPQGHHFNVVHSPKILRYMSATGG